MMGLLTTNPPIIIAKIVALFNFCCLLGAQIFILAFTTWLLLVKAVIKVQADILWNVVTWAFSIIFFPLRILTALQREKMIEAKLHEMKTQVDNLMLENKEVGERLNMSFRECIELEATLSEIEDELGKALEKVDQLENELQDLKDEKSQMSELRGKCLWEYQAKYDNECPVGASYGVPPCPSCFKGSRLTLQDVLIHGDTWCGEIKPNPTRQDMAVSQQLPLDDSQKEAILWQHRCVALSRSTFSAAFSLIVGMIIWEAEDPCLPLVGALFTVVGMSLISVVHFFSTINNKPASDAVALLSFNWFILGTLTSPTLPKVAKMLAPPSLRLGSRLLAALGYNLRA